MDASHSSDDDSPCDISVFIDAHQNDQHPNSASLGQPDLDRIRKAIQCTLDRHAQTTCSISVRLVSDDTIAEIHEQSMGICGPTDVLTFDLSDTSGPHSAPDDRSLEGDISIEGDIVISIDTAAREALARKHPLVHELMLYAIHATLHLLGFDDIEEADAIRMHAEEDKVLSTLGVGPVYGRPTT